MDLDALPTENSIAPNQIWAGCSHHTAAAWDVKRDGGLLPRPGERVERPRLIDPFMGKIEEWVERSQGKICADVAFERLVALGYGGSDCSVRRAVESVKANHRDGRRRVYRPWIDEPGMWAQ